MPDTASPAILSSRNVDETCAHLCAALGRRVDIRPVEAAGFAARFASRRVGPLRMVSATYVHAVECSTSDPLDTLALSIMMRGGSSIQGRHSAIELGVGEAGIYNSAIIERSIFQPGTEFRFLTVTKADIEALLARLFDRRIVLPTDIGPTRLPNQAAIRSLIAMIVAIEETASEAPGGVACPHALGLLRDATLMRIVEAIPAHRDWLDVQPARPASWQIRQALDFVEAQPGPVSIHEVAQAAGLGVRALQIAFQEQLGTTPSDYLKRVRLDAVRAALGKPDVAGTVGDIARRWGFSNITRFAAEYEKAFGSKPSRRKLNL